MIQIEFDLQTIESLKTQRFSHPDPKARQRLEALYLKSQNLRHKDICHYCGIGKLTLVNWLKLFQKGGIEALTTFHYKGQPSELNPHIEKLNAYFEKHPPHTSAEAQATVFELTGIHRCPTQIRELLKRMGMKLRKTGQIPKKVITSEHQQTQDEFLKKELEPRLQEAKEGKRTLFL